MKVTRRLPRNMHRYSSLNDGRSRSHLVVFMWLLVGRIKGNVDSVIVSRHEGNCVLFLSL